MPEANQPVVQEQPVQQPAPEPVTPMLHTAMWSKFVNGLKGIGQTADQLLQAPSLIPIYLASGAWGIIASFGRLMTFHKPKIKEDFTKATNFLPEWPRRIIGGGAYAWALLALC